MGSAQVHKQTTVHYFVPCPTANCETQVEITHIVDGVRAGSRPNGSSGPFDSCDVCKLSLSVTSITLGDDGEPTAELEVRPLRNDQLYETGLVIVRSMNHGGRDPIYMVVVDNHMAVHGTDKEVFRSRSFRYNEHTCVTNWLGDVHDVIYQGEIDPHGIFEVAAVFRQADVKRLTGFDLDDYLHADSNENDTEFLTRLAPEIFPQLNVAATGESRRIQPPRQALGWDGDTREMSDKQSLLAAPETTCEPPEKWLRTNPAKPIAEIEFSTYAMDYREQKIILAEGSSPVLQASICLCMCADRKSFATKTIKWTLNESDPVPWALNTYIVAVGQERQDLINLYSQILLSYAQYDLAVDEHEERQSQESDHG